MEQRRGAYFIGAAIDRLIGLVGIALGVLAVVVLIAFGPCLQRNEERLEEEAERHPPDRSGPDGKRK